MWHRLFFVRALLAGGMGWILIASFLVSASYALDVRTGAPQGILSSALEPV